MRSFAVVFTHADAVDVTLMVLGLGLLGAISYGRSTLPSALITCSSLSSKMNEVHRVTDSMGLSQHLQLTR
jgi:hypothetical protein